MFPQQQQLDPEVQARITAAAQAPRPTTDARGAPAPPAVPRAGRRDAGSSAPLPARAAHVFSPQNIAPHQRGMNRRTGSIATGPPPEADPANVALLTQNLQDNPLVAKLVSKGLLKTEDVMNEGYVRDMERSLRKQHETVSWPGFTPRR